MEYTLESPYKWTVNISHLYCCRWCSMSACRRKMSPRNCQCCVWVKVIICYSLNVYFLCQPYINWPLNTCLANCPIIAVNETSVLSARTWVLAFRVLLYFSAYVSRNRRSMFRWVFCLFCRLMVDFRRIYLDAAHISGRRQEIVTDPLDSSSSRGALVASQQDNSALFFSCIAARQFVKWWGRNSKSNPRGGTDDEQQQQQKSSAVDKGTCEYMSAPLVVLEFLSLAIKQLLGHQLNSAALRCKMYKD